LPPLRSIVILAPGHNALVTGGWKVTWDIGKKERTVTF